MTPLEQKFGVDRTTIIKLIKEGAISTSWLNYEEIYIHYKENLKSSSHMTEAVEKTADQRNQPRSSIFYCIHKFE